MSANASELEIHQTPAYAGYPVDYKVADFGKSHEIMYTENNIKEAEKALGHNLMADYGATKSTVATPRNYVVPDFGLDVDIKNSLHDLELEEKIHGAWNIDGFSGPKGVTNAKKEISRNHLGPAYVEAKNAVAGATGAKIGGGVMGI